jgi:hypothetical protein
MELQKSIDFDGVFRFSNNSDEDFTVLWNNKEYTFPAKTCSPMIIAGESPENVQEIRKRFAFKWAEREWYKGAEYKKLSNMGGGLPPTRNDATLEPLIQMCLSPLPTAKAKVVEGKKDVRNFKASKAIDEKANLNEAFKEDVKEENLVKLGKQKDEAIG